MASHHITTGGALPRFDALAALDRYRDGLMKRVGVDGEPRTMRVRLTDQGKARFAEMAGEQEIRVTDMLSGLGADQPETLIAHLSRIGEDS